MSESNKDTDKKNGPDEKKNDDKEAVRVGTVWDARSIEDEEDDASSENADDDRKTE